jgi:hypothetical protein
VDILDALEGRPLESHSRGLESSPIVLLRDSMKQQPQLLSAQIVTRREL